MKILFLSFLMLIIGYYFYKYSPEILEVEKKETNNLLRKFLAKYTTVFVLKIMSMIIMLLGIAGVTLFFYKNVF